MRKVSLSCLFSVLSVFLVANVFGQSYPYISGGGTFLPPSGMSPQLTMPAPGQAQALFGHHIVIADFNGDTKGEIVVGAPFVNVGSNLSQGQVFIYAGSGGCIYTNGDFDGTLNHPDTQPGAQFGFTVATADIDNDGNPDLIVSAPFFDVKKTEDQGRVYIFFGPDFRQWNYLDKPGDPAQHALFGWSLAAGRLVPGGPSTQSVIVVGAPEEDDGAAVLAGKAYVFMPTGARKAKGGPLPVSSSVTHTLSSGSQAGARYGYAVALGDISGDGTVDVIIGAPFWDHIVAGDVDNGYADEGIVEYWTSGVAAVQVLAASYKTNAYFGFSLAAADVDNNGHVDIIAGAPGETFSMGGIPFVSAGQVYRIDVEGVTSYRSPMETSDGQFGFTVAAGDIDRDGIPDIIAGAIGETTISYRPGSVYAFTSSGLYIIPSTGLPLQAQAFTGPPAGVRYHDFQDDALFGYAIAVGEIQTASLDLAIGAIGRQVGGNLNQGMVYLFIEDSPPNVPAIVAPATGSNLHSGTVNLQAGPFSDRNIETCGTDFAWSDKFGWAHFRISTLSEHDCKSDTPTGVVYDQYFGPPGVTSTPPIDLANLGFNSGATVYWCVAYFDEYFVSSGFASSSFFWTVTDVNPQPVPTSCQLADQIIQTMLSLNLPKSVENSYMKKLKEVCGFVEEGKITQAINQLKAFINNVRTDITKGNISEVAGNNLINMATNLTNIIKS